MPTARPSRFVWLRPLVAITLLLLAAASLAAAYNLASQGQNGYGYFVTVAAFFGLWASVVATNARVSAAKVLEAIRGLRSTNAMNRAA